MSVSLRHEIFQKIVEIKKIHSRFSKRMCLIDSKVFKLLFFAYKDKIFNTYEKIILVAHWSLIADDFLVKDQAETVRNDVLFDGCSWTFDQ